MTQYKKHAPPPKVENVETAQEVINFLWDKIIELEDQINQNSKNSSMPPSSNHPGRKPKSNPNRKPSGKKPGAQQGHKGSRRAIHPHDERLSVEQHMPQEVCHCGGQVVANAAPSRVHQVFDIPKQLYFVKEHQLYSGQCCRCGEGHKTPLPQNVSCSQMGANLLAWVALQSGQFHQSIVKIQQQMKQSFGLDFSTGAISEAQGRVSAMLTPTHQAIKAAVQASPVIHADETRHQRHNQTYWMWLASSAKAVCFLTSGFRNQLSGKRLLGDLPQSYLITDQYSGYNFVDDEQRQLCLAHILRNVTAIAESGYSHNRRVGKRLVLIMQTVFRTQHRWEEGLIEKSRYLRRMQRLRGSWKNWLEKGYYQCSKKYRGRCQRLISVDAMVWRFLEQNNLPLTNNEAERLLRSYVLWRKCSYGTRSHRGDLFRQRILSLIETAKKLELCPMAWLRAITKACIEKLEYPLPEALRE